MPEAPPPAPPPAAEAPAETTPSAPADFQARAAALIEGAPASPPNGAPAPATPATPPPAETPAVEPFAAKFAQIAEASKRLRGEQDAFKATVREREETLRREASALDQLRTAKEAADPIAALQALGFTYEQATDQVLGKYQPKGKPEAPKADPVVATLRQELEALKAERAAERNAQALADFRSDMVKTATAAGDKYQLVAATESFDDAVALVDAYASAHGEFPGGTREAAIEMALGHIEKQLESRYLSERVLTSQKVKSRLAPAVEAPKPAAARPQATSAKSPPSSLSNSLAAAPPPRAAPEPRSKEDFIAAAAEVLKGAG